MLAGFEGQADYSRSVTARSDNYNKQAFHQVIDYWAHVGGWVLPATSQLTASCITYGPQTRRVALFIYINMTATTFKVTLTHAVQRYLGVKGVITVQTSKERVQYSKQRQLARVP